MSNEMIVEGKHARGAGMRRPLNAGGQRRGENTPQSAISIDGKTSC
jgi:hypothetical protein